MNSTVLLKSVDIQIPGYRILRPIGEGGMASVFLAVQESLDREVALKVMSPTLASNSEFASRFLTEGKITAKLQHPNLVTVYDIGTHGGVYYLAAEYIPGGTLKERITEGGMSVADILDVVSDIALGLDFAHQKGFVHRDVKPGNVLFRHDGRVVLADFGIAKAMDGSNSSTIAGSSIGTPDYMSPEQARGEAVDGRSDLYSLGTVLYEMLLGHAPYQAPDPFTVALMHVTHPVPELPEEYAWLQPLITGLMAKQAAERYNTGAAFVDALHALVATAPKGALGVSTRRLKPGSANRLSGSAATQQRTRVSLSREDESKRGLLWMGLGAAAVIAVGVGVWQWMKPDVGVDPAQTTQSSTDAVVQAPSVPLDNSAAQSQPVEPIAAPVQPVEASAEDIQTWLTQADAYVQQNIDGTRSGANLDEEQDSAVALYRQVLRADPGNARAEEGMRKTATYFERIARKWCERGSWVYCASAARRGLAIDPDAAALQSLLQKAENGGDATQDPAPREALKDRVRDRRGD